MGCVQSTETKTKAEAKTRNDEIEHQLKQDRLNVENEIKVLLIDADESGESAFQEQLKLVFYGDYNNQERGPYKGVILFNTTQSMRAVLDAMPYLEIAPSPQNDTRRAVILALPDHIEAKVLSSDVIDAVRGLWDDLGVKEAARRSHKF